MNTHISGQALLIELETALHRLVESFWEEPYRYFTESDAVTALWQWVARRPGLAQTYRTVDGFETGLLHREYPTFFRFSKQDPSERLPPPARRGHYDLVLLDPAYIEQDYAERVTNRAILDEDVVSSPPLLAAVEFKFFARAWSPLRVRGVKQDLKKLRLTLESPPYAHAAYFCVFQRDVSQRLTRWNRDWPTVEKMLADFPEIRAVVTAFWPRQKERPPFVYYSGPWISTAVDEI